MQDDQTTRPPRATFDIHWLNYDGHCFDVTATRRRDLTAAIVTACNMLKLGKCPSARLAHGFYVRKSV